MTGAAGDVGHAVRDEGAPVIRRRLMTATTWDFGMGTNQRIAHLRVVVELHPAPAIGGVAALTARVFHTTIGQERVRELATMNVFMADTAVTRELAEDVAFGRCGIGAAMA